MTEKAERGQSRGFTLVELLVVIAIIGILSAIAIQNVVRAIDNARTARTMADMRLIARGVILRAEQTNNYPTENRRVRRIARLLQPYIGRVPTKDSWGHDPRYEFVDDDEDPARGAFRIISFGKDGRRDDADFVTGVWVDFNSDIVLQEETFIQSKW